MDESDPHRPGTLPAIREAARDTSLEFALTTILLFTVVSTVRWVFGPGAPSQNWIQGGKFALVGLVVALLLIALIRSGWGRKSGAHLNPAITAALWIMGSFPGRRVPGYMVAQFLGSLAGTALAGLAWGRAASGAPVNFAAVAPGPSVVGWQVAAMEAGCLVIITLIVGYFLSHPDERTTRMLPFVLAAVSGVIVFGLGPVSGGSTNPARQFGPAILSNHYEYLAIYLIAPVVGAVIGAVIHRRLLRVPPATYKLFGLPAPTQP